MWKSFSVAFAALLVFAVFPVATAAEKEPAGKAAVAEKDAPVASVPAEPAEKEAADPKAAKPAEAGAEKAAPAKEDAAKPEAKAVVPAGKKKNAAASEPGSASYFGVKTEGNRFVFVVDNSDSMSKGRFDTACYELVNTVHDLTEKQVFYVILFSDGAYPLFYPNSAKGYVPATSQNKAQLYEWLKTIECVRGTNAQPAMALALAAKPDAVYLLTDGAFTDDTTKYLLGLQKGPTKVFTLGLKEGAGKGGAAKALTQIAEHFGGTYTAVGVNPQFKEMERPTNGRKNGIWGIALGNKKDKN